MRPHCLVNWLSYTLDCKISESQVYIHQIPQWVSKGSYKALFQETNKGMHFKNKWFKHKPNIILQSDIILKLLTVGVGGPLGGSVS